jgi:hypothetical protein
MSKTGFEWDEAKDAANQLKHGVSFTLAQHAFLDPHRVIAKAQSPRSSFLLLRRDSRRHFDGTVHLAGSRNPNHWRRFLARGQGNL